MTTTTETVPTYSVCIDGTIRLGPRTSEAYVDDADIRQDILANAAIVASATGREYAIVDSTGTLKLATVRP